MEGERIRLKALLRHWVEHSLEHKKNFEEWSEKAKDMKLHDVSRYLALAAEDSERIAEHLSKALEAMR